MAARTIIRSLNADARIIETDHARVDASATILDTGLFDFDSAHGHPTLAQGTQRVQRACAGNRRIRDIEFRLSRPAAVRAREAACILQFGLAGRCPGKGFFWLASRPQWVGELSQAGALVRHEAIGYWWAAVPKKRWPDDDSLVARIDKGWHKVWGDRRQEIVFIGTRDMDTAKITADLDACLLPIAENGPIDASAWRALPDPFPEWRRDAA